ncbi:hypothetical protein V5O48_014233 [Marasmius crinis-equi]|uniref:Uncharacterized protein n=1 Tax=Marasmius crinis-equi TaxID=585013 RepID=A0ABR3EXW0_9AGAR
MSDATGPISGGTSDLMMVGDPTSGVTCDTTPLANDFDFTIDGTLTQCENFQFTQYDSAILPLTIFAFIPNGSDSFVIPFSPPQAESFTWKANVTAQTQVAISMIDSQDRSGGTESLRPVAGSSDKSCLLSNDTSGSTTAVGPAPTGVGPAPTGVSPNSDSQNKTSLSTGVIAGIAVGGTLVAILLAGLIWRFMRRRSKVGRAPSLVPAQYRINPFPVFLAPGAGRINASASSLQPDYEGPFVPSSSGSRTPTKPPNLIVHRDIEEAVRPIDLPPHYVDRRTPIPDLAGNIPPPVGGRRKKR